MKMFLKLAVMAVVLGMFALPAGFAKSNNSSATPVMVDDDDQTHMQAALDALKQAEQHLQEAKHDKGGHRAKALALTRDAIKHVELGMKAGDKNEDKHEHKKK